MKKVLVTILAIFYLGVSSGATMQFHYCMGRLVEWGLAVQKSENCDKCGMSLGTTKDCCKTSAKEFKIESSYKTSDHQFLLKASALDLLSFDYPASIQSFPQIIGSDHPYSNAPPGISSIPVFIRNCNFRI
ncbi:HYC_CC_PP family protein [Desertivirga arenae]|uniref:HYC_CC_PP family protein n=1 Tax=Desertivirga arenae TaxID=2810309 RepID=UPI001A9662A3|nr:hypothetical protein [Pedobacter sp. SYSU D00823]